MDLLTSDGFDSIMVVVDHESTKGVILESCNKTITAEQTGNILLNSLYKHFGLPDKAISVRGHLQLYVPLYIPYLLFIFHLHFALLTYIFVTVWLPPYFEL